MTANAPAPIHEADARGITMCDGRSDHRRARQNEGGLETGLGVKLRELEIAACSDAPRPECQSQQGPVDREPTGQQGRVVPAGRARGEVERARHKLGQPEVNQHSAAGSSRVTHNNDTDPSKNTSPVSQVRSMLSNPIPSATKVRTIADRGIAASIVPIHRELTTPPVWLRGGLGLGPIQPETQDFSGRQHGQSIRHEEQTVMVGLEVLDYPSPARGRRS